MKKNLGQMTAEELGNLFPIRLIKYDPQWPKLFSAEEKKIVEAVGIKSISRIEHIGSTAVPGLCAKPTIDILLEIQENADCNFLVKQLKKIKYEFISKPENPAPHMMFAKGYSVNGVIEQTFHIHVRYPGDWDEIVFRDQLRHDPEVRSAYIKLKIRLAEDFRNNREKYTEGKTSFIQNAVMKARKGNIV